MEIGLRVKVSSVKTPIMTMLLNDAQSQPLDQFKRMFYQILQAIVLLCLRKDITVGLVIRT